MKHKAQALVDMFNDYRCMNQKGEEIEIPKWYVENIKTGQDLIDCQLTVEEIIAIQSFVANCSNYITKQAKLGLIGAESLANINVLLPEIFSGNKKLNKQKEMWASNND